ncbi:pentatricopeptide repeat-containing protein [Tanacetum coccineum]
MTAGSWIMVCVLKAYGETMNVKLGEQVHGWLIKSGYGGDLFIGSKRNVVVWTARIINNCKEEQFREISDDGNCGEQVHANVIKLGLASKSYVQCGLVNMYGKFGLMNDAKRVFYMNESRRNRACWNDMLTSLIQNGCLVEAIKFLYQMRAAGVQPQELWLNKLRSLYSSERRIVGSQQIKVRFFRYGQLEKRSSFNLILLRHNVVKARRSQVKVTAQDSYQEDMVNKTCCSANHKIAKLADFGLAREESLTEMMTTETGTYRWMAPELYKTVIPRHGDKKHYNHKAAYDVAFMVHQIRETFTGFEMYYVFHNLQEVAVKRMSAMKTKEFI